MSTATTRMRRSASAGRFFLFAGRRTWQVSDRLAGVRAREEEAGDCFPGIENLMDVT
jgi:hypothetical protein